MGIRLPNYGFYIALDLMGVTSDLSINRAGLLELHRKPSQQTHADLEVVAFHPEFLIRDFPIQFLTWNRHRIDGFKPAFQVVFFVDFQCQCAGVGGQATCHKQ